MVQGDGCLRPPGLSSALGSPSADKLAFHLHMKLLHSFNQPAQLMQPILVLLF